MLVWWSICLFLCLFDWLTVCLSASLFVHMLFCLCRSYPNDSMKSFRKLCCLCLWKCYLSFRCYMNYGKSESASFGFFFISTVFSKPTILLHPKDVSISLEDTVITIIFTCEATGFPLPVISWLKNNSTVTSGTLIQNGSISSLVLLLRNREDPPGKYRCIAENSVGKTSSKEAALVIRPQKHSLGVRKYLCSNIFFLLTFLSDSSLWCLSGAQFFCFRFCFVVCLFVCLSVSLSASLFVHNAFLSV